MAHELSILDRFKEELRVLTPRKLYNIFMAEAQLLLKSSRLSYLPYRISIETGNICNLRCPLCPTGQHQTGIERGFMSFDDYKKIIDEIARDLILVRLYNWGEPLLNKELIPMITYAHHKGIGVTISINLNILDDKTARELLTSGLSKIFVSCDGVSQETYNQYHVGGDFHQVLENLRLLLKEKEKMQRCATRILWLFHVFRHNEHEVEKAKTMAKDLGVEIRINLMRTDMGKEIFETAKQSIERDSQWIPKDTRYCPFDLDKNDVKKKKRFCDLLWKETVINWDGEVLPCCAVYDEHYSFGNAFKKDFRTIWNGESYIAARKAITEKKNDIKTVCYICKSYDFTHF
jgi:radical SAM protein with 4Fe4S-binding SPASM domain